MTRLAAAAICSLCQSRATMNPDGVCNRCVNGAPIPVQAAAPMEAHPLAAVHAAPPPRESPTTLMWLGALVTGFVVYGEPASQGSKNKGQHGNLYESAAKKIRPWRSAVRDAFLAVRPPGWEPLAGPVVLDLVFTIKRPLAEPKTVRTFPGRNPDVDKLQRSTLDGLKEAGLYNDDGQVIGYRRMFEVYAGDPDPDALTSPGAVIRAWRAPIEPRT